MVSFYSASSVCAMPFLYTIAAHNRCIGLLFLTLSGCLGFFDGDIVERGDYDELLAADELYANLWGVQAGEIEDLPEAFVERATGQAAGSRR